jgi:hypothetical protein
MKTLFDLTVSSTLPHNEYISLGYPYLPAMLVQCLANRGQNKKLGFLIKRCFIFDHAEILIGDRDRNTCT